MKTVIYYYSKTGHTKAYAFSLSQRLENVDVFKAKQMRRRVMKQYDTIIFMSPVHGNRIKYVEKFLKHYPKIKEKNLFIVAVGMQPATSERRETLITVNLLDEYHIRLYELMGGFDINKLPWILRKLMKIGLKAAMGKDETLKAQQDQVNSFLKFPFEYNDISGIERLLDKLHELDRASKMI